MSTDHHNKEFQEIVESNRGIIYKIANTYCRDSEDRKDLVQEILIQIWKSLDRYDNKYKMSTWIYRIALNISISHYRKILNSKGKLTILEIDPANTAEDGNTSDYPDEEINRLHQFIRELNELERALILLYLEEKSHNEMAEIMGISETNVATRISRIKKKLKQRFEQN